MKDVIIIPTYNEKDNVGQLIQKIQIFYPDFELWIVDDNSPDGTADIISAFSEKNNKIKLFSRSGKTGLGDAYKYIHSKIQGDKSIRYVVTMDADGSHDPQAVGDLIKALSNCDLVVGSRYVKGGRIIGWGPTRFILSYFGNIYSRIITGLPIKDGTAGFVAFRRSIIDAINFSSIGSAGYSYQIEFKNAVLKNGGSFVEIPITFADRQIGKSKMSGNIVAEGLIMPWRILLKNKEDFKHRLKIVIVSFLFLFGLFFSFFKLSESPSVWYDEGIYYQMAANLSNHGISGLIVTPGNIEHFSKLSVGYPLIYPIALSLAIFGNNILVARAAMAMFISGLLIAAYLLVKKSVGKNASIFSLALLVSFAPLYANGKSVLGEVPGLLYLTLSLLFMRFAVIKKDQKSQLYFLALSGFFAGLCVTTKPIFIVFICALAFAFLIKRRDFFHFGKKIFLFPIFLIIPLIIWLFTQFQSNDSPSQILAFYANPQHVGSLYYAIFTNISLFFKEIGLTYLLIMLVVWSASIFIRVKKQKLKFEEISSFIFSLLVTVAFLRTSGYLRYVFPAQILSIIYFPGSIYYCLGFIQSRVKSYSRVHKVFSRKSAIILFAILFIFGTYQLMFNSWIADSYGSRKTAFWENYFSALPSEEKVFFYDTPEVAMFTKNINYYQYLDLSPASLLVGENNSFLIDKGGADRVILKTDTFQNEKNKWEKHYRIDKKAFKYSILVKK